MQFYGEEKKPHPMKGKKLSKAVLAARKGRNKRRSFKYGSPVGRHCISMAEDEWNYAASRVMFSKVFRGSISAYLNFLVRKDRARRERLKLESR